MNTANIKSFAQQARLLLMDGVAARLTYWGFDEEGNSTQNLQVTTGGYTFREGVFTDTAVPAKWKKLKTRLKDQQAVKDVIEEAAYTWFNRLMAIKILEKNGYLAPQLQYADQVKIPEILQRAKRGVTELKNPLYKDLLREYLTEDKEEAALGLLLSRLSNNNPLLHDVFGRIDDYTEILLPQNLLQRNGILDLINSDRIADEDYKEVELIGWLYQFYISDKKDEVFKGFKNNKKARAEDIPAATQIFTPKWIVKYMVENTLGKTYLDFEPDSGLKHEMKYLVENEAKTPGQAIINDVQELSLLDPASGSGHILVTGFELLFKMYREAGYNAKQATLNILEYNLFGLDIDDRAMQLARFAVLLKAAKGYPEILQPLGKQQKIQLPHIYAFPVAAEFTNDELKTFLGEDQEYLADLKEAMQLLNQGKNIGTALKFKLPEAAHTAIASQYQTWKNREHNLDFNEQLIWNKLKNFIEVLLVMTRQYIAVVANPPYLGPRNMNGELKKYIDKYYPLTKADLFAAFMEICLNLIKEHGLVAMINQESWLFNSSYKFIRKKIVEEFEIKSLLHLGTRTFDEVSGEKVRSVAFTIGKPRNCSLGTYFKLTESQSSQKKEKSFLEKQIVYKNVDQSTFGEIEGTPFAYWISPKVLHLFEVHKSLDKYSSPRKGNSTSNNSRFLKFWYEVNKNKSALKYKNIDDALNSGKNWIPYNKGGGTKKWYGYNEYLIDWTDNGNPIRNIPTAVVTNEKYYMKPGLTWSAISSKTFGLRYFNEGFIFDNNGCCLFDLNNNKEYLAGLLNSKVFFYIIGQLNPALAFHPGDVKKFPVIIKDSKLKSLENYQISKKDWDSRETSWDFEQNPLLKINASSLKESYSQWQKEITGEFFQLHQNEEEHNRIFIDIYGLQEEITPEVPLKEITILQEELNRKALAKLEPEFRKNGNEAIELPIEEDEVLSQFVSYLIGVMMGRYRLDKPGLNIAHPNPTEKETAIYTYNGHKIEIDKDAILPLMGEDCAFPDDIMVQLKKLLQAIWGEDSLTDNINFLQQSLDTSLHNWLTTRFWKNHTGMYKKKPIYWLFSSNPKKPEKSAFKVLVYMHRMDKFTVQQIQRNYLYPHQDHIKGQLQNLKENEANLSKEEQKELEKLQSWELELRDYNEVLKNLANQQIEFDLDDGVSVNYEKFEGAVAMI